MTTLNTTNKNEQTAPMHEAFRFTGAQLDAILLFAEQRGLENRTLQYVVEEYCRCHAKAA